MFYTIGKNRNKNQMLKILQYFNHTKNMDSTKKKAHIIKPGRAEEKSFIFDPQALYSLDSFWLLA